MTAREEKRLMSTTTAMRLCKPKKHKRLPFAVTILQSSNEEVKCSKGPFPLLVLLVVNYVVIQGFTSFITLGGACLDEFYQHFPLVPMGKFGKFHPNKYNHCLFSHIHLFVSPKVENDLDIFVCLNWLLSLYGIASFSIHNTFIYFQVI